MRCGAGSGQRAGGEGARESQSLSEVPGEAASAVQRGAGPRRVTGREPGSDVTQHLPGWGRGGSWSQAPGRGWGRRGSRSQVGGRGARGPSFQRVKVRRPAAERAGWRLQGSNPAPAFWGASHEMKRANERNKTIGEERAPPGASISNAPGPHFTSLSLSVPRPGNGAAHAVCRGSAHPGRRQDAAPRPAGLLSSGVTRGPNSGKAHLLCAWRFLPSEQLSPELQAIE